MDKLLQTLTAAFAALCVCSAAAEGKTMPHPNSKTRESILQWIPQTTTNLTVLNAPFTYYNGNSQPIDPESMFEFVAVKPIFWPPEGSDWEHSTWLRSSDLAKIAYIDDAAPQFEERAYASFGFFKSNQELEGGIVKCMQDAAKSELKMFGTPVYLFESKPCKNERPTTEYRSLVSEGVLVSTNCRDFLAHILIQKDHENILQSNLTEWEGLDTLSSYWGFRQFSKADREKLQDEKALGYNFEYDKTESSLTLRYFTHSESVSTKLSKLIGSISKVIDTESSRSSTSDAKVITLKTLPIDNMGNGCLMLTCPMMAGLAAAAAKLDDNNSLQ